MLRVQVITTPNSEKAIRLSGDRGGRLVTELPGIVDRSSILLAGEIAENELGPSGLLNVVSGNLRRSIASRVDVSGGGITAYIGVTKGPAVKYARIHEEGGVIKAKPGKALAVPLDAARTAGGKLKYPGGPREAGKREELIFIDRRAQGKPPLLVKVHRTPGKPGGKAAGFEPWYVLLKSVRVPAKRYLSGGVQRHFEVFRVSIRFEIDELYKAA